jgi:tetratricopeptide (TPR) repeat protein
MTWRRYFSKPVVAVMAIIVVSFAFEMYQAHRHKQQSNATAGDNQHWKKASKLRAAGKHQEAISEYVQALRTLSHNSMLRQELAYELQLTGNDDEAAVQLRKVISIDRATNENKWDLDSEVHSDLGKILERKGDLREGLKEYCLAADISPDVYFYHTEVQRLSKQLNLSSEECGKYLSHEEDDIPPDRDVF